MRSVVIAVSRNSLSPQMIGVELPSPGGAIFQRTLVLRPRWWADRPTGAVPLASGPRH